MSGLNHPEPEAKKTDRQSENNSTSTAGQLCGMQNFLFAIIMYIIFDMTYDNVMILD